MRGKGVTTNAKSGWWVGVNPERGWLERKKQYLYLENERQEEKTGEQSIRGRARRLGLRRARTRRGRIK